MPRANRRNALVRFAAILTVTAPLCAFAADPAPSNILPDRPDLQTPTPQEAATLGRDFESKSAGIAFRAPFGMKEIRSVGEDVVVRYVDEKRKWVLRVTKLQFDRKVPLTTPAQPATQGANSTEAPKGLLELTAEQLKLNAPGAEILRQDTTTIAGAEVGMLVGKFNIGVDTDLTQQAIFRSNDRLYYQFDLTTPAPRVGELEKDPDVKLAVDTFGKMLDSVKLLEQTAIRQEQVDRLFHTRTLFVNCTEDKIRKTIIPEQWLRILMNGKDVGYSYIVEEIASDIPRDGNKQPKLNQGDQGLLVGVRSRVMPEPGVRKDAGTWMWMSFDRKHEKWSDVAVTDKGPNTQGRPQTDTFADVGTSDLIERTVFDKGRPPGEQINKTFVDEKQPANHIAEVYTLRVEHLGKSQTPAPTLRDLPVFYIPEAMAEMLPRLVPRRQPMSYMFASYVADRSEVMARYVDVGVEDQFRVGDQVVDAIPVHDRIGLEGSVTTTYISPKGEFLGTINPDSKITIVSSDAATLQQIWKDANLTRPDAAKESVQGK